MYVGYYHNLPLQSGQVCLGITTILMNKMLQCPPYIFFIFPFNYKIDHIS